MCRFADVFKWTHIWGRPSRSRCACPSSRAPPHAPRQRRMMPPPLSSPPHPATSRAAFTVAHRFMCVLVRTRTLHDSSSLPLPLPSLLDAVLSMSCMIFLARYFLSRAPSAERLVPLATWSGSLLSRNFSSFSFAPSVASHLRVARRLSRRGDRAREQRRRSRVAAEALRFLERRPCGECRTRRAPCEDTPARGAAPKKKTRRAPRGGGGSRADGSFFLAAALELCARRAAEQGVAARRTRIPARAHIHAAHAADGRSRAQRACAAAIRLLDAVLRGNSHERRANLTQAFVHARGGVFLF